MIEIVPTALALLAIVLPWALGERIIAGRRGSSESCLFLIGSGWLLGQGLAAAGLWLTRGSDGTLRVRFLLAALMGAIIWQWVTRPSNRQPRPEPASSGRCPALWNVVLILIGAGLLLKLLIAVATNFGLPIRGDDAISLWQFKAKSIVTLGKLPVDSADPFFMGGSNPHYPPTLPLMAAWVPLVQGQWSEFAGTLIWPLTWVALVMMLGGGLQPFIGRIAAWVVAYAVGSMPLVWVHVMRPGYADLPLAAYITAAVLFIWKWQRSGYIHQLALGMVFAGFAACLKREGPFLAGVVMVAGVMPYWRQKLEWTRREWVWMSLLLLGICAAVAWIMDFSEQAEAARGLAWHPEVIGPLMRHAFGWSSFQFLPVVIVASMIGVMVYIQGPARLAMALLFFGLVGFVAGVFLLTPQARFAMNDQTPSRLILQIMPGLVCALAITLAPLMKRGECRIEKEKARASGGTP